MELELIQIIAIGVVIFAGALIRSAVGFGAGLFAIPIIVWIGVPLPETIAIVLAAVIVQSAMAGFRLRQHIPWRPLIPAAIIRGLVLPAGTWLLYLISGLDMGQIKQILGAVLLVVVVVIWVYRPRPRERLPVVVDYLTFITSGLMAATIGMGGPPLVLWVMAHKWTTHQTRSFLIVSFFLTTPIQIIIYALAFGRDILTAALLGLAFFPLILLGTQAGLWVGHHLSKNLLRQLAYGLLILVAAWSITGPLIM